jgi:hypothetical protein
VRSGIYSVSKLLSNLVVLLLFGDNFSDLRDSTGVYAK